MKSTTKALCLVASAALASTSQLALAGQSQIVVYAEDAKHATDQAVVHEATCPSGKYKLRINQNDDRVEFEFDGATRGKVDLSSTPFGQTFLKRALNGKFFSYCPKDGGIRVTFYGIEPAKGSVLKPVKYRITFGNDGAVKHDSGLADTTAEGINIWFPRMEQP